MRRIIRVAEATKVAFAREQRRELTRAERLLWRRLRGKRMGAKFRRQHPIREFVVDFYCDEARLAVELDGEVHDKQREYDSWRDEQLARDGIRVLRIPSDEVHRSLSSVMERIKSSLAT